MKFIVAIIKPQYLDRVKAELRNQEVSRLTVIECQGFGEQLGHTEVYRGQEYEVKLVPKLQLEIACNDKFVQPTIDAITRAAKTEPNGAVGDGKIFVMDLEECIKIRTGEKGSTAI